VGRVSAVVAALIAVYGVGAFAAALRRYIVGEGGSVTDMIHAPAWQPPLGWPALVALMAVASVVMLVWNLLLVRSATRSETPAPVHA